MYIDTTMKKITIAIDGHSSCGKSTMAKELARQLGYVYVDTGAMYRAVTLYALRNGLMDEVSKNIDTEALQSRLSDIIITQSVNAEGKVETFLNGESVEGEIRQMLVSSCVSPIAALGFVREHLVACQQAMGKEGGIVMDGRDIGTVVFPKAELKLFLTASPEVRAERRYKELIEKGEQPVMADVLADVNDRDYRDTHRAESPLKQAADAVVVDNSNMTREEQIQHIYRIFNEACK